MTEYESCICDALGRLAPCGYCTDETLYAIRSASTDYFLVERNGSASKWSRDINDSMYGGRVEMDPILKELRQSTKCYLQKVIELQKVTEEAKMYWSETLQLPEKTSVDFAVPKVAGPCHVCEVELSEKNYSFSSLPEHMIKPDWTDDTKALIDKLGVTFCLIVRDENTGEHVSTHLVCLECALNVRSEVTA